MPIVQIDTDDQNRHTDDVKDIIETVPPWILRWGITLFFVVLLLILVLSAIIRYPDIVKTQLKIESPNSPKKVISKVAGKLTKLLVKENIAVVNGQQLAYVESTGNHEKISKLAINLQTLQMQVLEGKQFNQKLFLRSDNRQLGELQSAYQTFYQEYLNYIMVEENGFYLKKKIYLENDLKDLSMQTQQLNKQKQIQQRAFTLAGEDYEMHKKLENKKVETIAELRQQESKYLSQKSPLVQTESAIITAKNNYAAKQKEILELENQINEEKAKFLQSLNSLISQAEDWKNKYIITASGSGMVSYVGIIQENQMLASGQEIFYINPGDEAFFGQMFIPQDNMGKIKEGQEVLIKLKSYPFEEYGIIRGNISYLSEIPYKDSVFVSKVNFKMRTISDMKKTIRLKQGMVAAAEIITEDATLLQRLMRNLRKAINKN